MAIVPPQNINDKANRVSIWHTDIKDLMFGSPPRASTKEISVFCRKLSFLLGSGLTIRSSLPIIGAQTKEKGMRSAVRKLHSYIEQGESLSSAFFNVNYFPPFMCGYVNIGEKTGKFADVFDKLANYYEEHAKIKNELTAALVYPAIVMVVMISVIVLAVAFVLPGYAEIFAGADISMPRITSMLISASSFISHNIIFIAWILFIVSFGVLLFFKHKTGKMILAVIKLKIPLTAKGANLKITESLSILLNSGINISDAVNACIALVDNIKVQSDFYMLESNLQKGVPFWVSLAELKYISPLFVEMAKIGEESGMLPQTITKCNEYFLMDYKHDIKKLNKLIEPIITLVLGVVLALVMLAVVLPTFEIAGVM